MYLPFVLRHAKCVDVLGLAIIPAAILPPWQRPPGLMTLWLLLTVPCYGQLGNNQVERRGFQ
jgi:hypothetical protein